MTSLTVPPIATATKTLKLDLGCGQNPKEGYEGVDKWSEKAKHKIDLCKFPWPWEDNSVDALHSSHFLEHIDARYTEARDLGDPSKLDYLDRDMLCCFMDEAWRVLKPNGEFTIQVPNAFGNRGFQDPTHRRFFVRDSWYYFNKAWRESQGLDHYLCRVANFGFEVNHSMPIELGALSDEAQRRRFNENINTIYDWIVRLVAIKS